jgi:hypothetical protein
MWLRICLSSRGLVGFAVSKYEGPFNLVLGIFGLVCSAKTNILRILKRFALVYVPYKRISERKLSSLK